VKASKREAFQLPTRAELFARDVRSIISNSAETMQGLELQLLEFVFSSQGIMDLSTKCFLQFVAFFLNSSPSRHIQVVVASLQLADAHAHKYEEMSILQHREKLTINFTLNSR